MTFYADEIATRITKLDAYATKLGQRFGIPSARLPVETSRKWMLTGHLHQEALTANEAAHHGCMKSAIEQADRTLAFLEEAEFE